MGMRKVLPRITKSPRPKGGTVRPEVVAEAKRRVSNGSYEKSFVEIIDETLIIGNLPKELNFRNLFGHVLAFRKKRG